MCKYIIPLSTNPKEWQLWAAAQLQHFDVKAIRTPYFAAENRLSFQYNLEQKGCHVSLDNDLLQALTIHDTPSSEVDCVLNVCNIPTNLLKEQFGRDVKVWDICYHNQSLADCTHIGEYEQQHDQPSIHIHLVEDTCRIVDTACYQIHYSAVRNFTTVAYSVHLLLQKGIRQASATQTYFQPSQICYNKLTYLKDFYTKILSLRLVQLANRLYGYYGEKWTVGLGRGSFLKDGIRNMKVLPMPQTEFWADPFVYRNRVDGKIYLFIERFPFKEKKGVLACAELDDEFNVHNMHDILTRPYHLSYPHLIEEDGELYMMPECSANRQLEVYRCVQFPDQWELYSCGMKGECLADTVYYRDKNGDAWLFTAQCDTSVDLHCTIMNIYKVDSLKLNQIIPHKQNPIIINCEHSRNGGRIYEENGRCYRVAQNNTHGMYGYGISVREIVKLTIDEYEEVEVKQQLGRNIPAFLGTHQMCQIDGVFAMDLRKS
ncbi:MAG: hypothetical protein HUK01_06795 [Bacteroidaceae bacterium]|nr:hypothetical protein [Bacteroidaceae bacterium]